MSNKIKPIENFVSEEDRAKAITVIEQLMSKTNSSPSVPGYDSRFIFFRPTQKDAVDFVKKYAKKSQENYDYAPEAVIHDVIFAKSFVGAELTLHMDFQGQDACKECTHACVMYLNKDYEGAEIYFPEFKESYSPNAGTAIIFPQDDDKYIHGVSKLTSGERYMVNMCFTINKDRQFPIYK